MSDSKGDGSLANADIRLFESGNFADATIVCGDRTWNVHKLILSSRCKWFKAAFHGSLAESVSGKVVLEEQDADLVDILLRFIYAKDISVSKLRDSKDVPALCVQLFRLGDFFLLEDLKAKVTSELKAHIDNTLMFLDTKTGDDQTPQWLTEVLAALEEAYKDGSTRPILETLLRFVCLNKHKIFQFQDAVALIDKIPEMARDLVKSYLIGDMAAQPRTSRFRLALPVIEAVQLPDCLYELSTAKFGPVGSPKLPCLLYPVLDSHIIAFRPVHPTTERETNALQWMAPHAHTVKVMTSHPDSEIVRVESEVCQGLKNVLYIRFDDCGDARVYVERYCRAKPEIESRTANSGLLGENMRLKIAGMTGRL